MRIKVEILIRQHRLLNGIGIRAYAKTLGLTHSTLSRIENAKPIDAVTQLKLINHFFGS